MTTAAQTQPDRDSPETSSQRLEFLAPAKLLSANQRLHHYARNALTQEWRQAAHMYALAHKLRRLHRAHIIVTIGFPTGHKRDINNYQPTAKAIIDGLIDYRLLPDDNDVYLVGPDLRAGDRVSTLVPSLVVDIHELCLDEHHADPHRGCILR